MMIKGMVVDDSMSNLTSASNEPSISSGHRDEQSQPAKKKRNLPGNPDPEAEVIALSPRALLATNRFICEVCNKGFQRDQNLQLHRRGHNLPWKLKQRSNKEVIRKKVYVCPEVTCVHHDPSRALGDLTGIKKHFCRKHGEKKWKCEKCSKRYAVQSDWKAHSKICGTREYRCDCGTLFSRRDSFITHRAFCDALAEESVRAIITSNPLSFSQPGTSTGHQLNLQRQFHSHGLPSAFPLKREQDLQESFDLRPELGSGPIHSDLSSTFFTPRLEESIMQPRNSNPNNPMLISSLQPTAISPHMSATALLQKAAQMGVTMSKPSQSKTILRPHQVHMITTTGLSSTSLATSIAGSSLGLSSREDIGDGFIHGLASFGNKSAITSSCMEQVGPTTDGASGPPSLLHDMISSLPSASHEFEESGFGGSNFNGILSSKPNRNFEDAIPKPKGGGNRSGNEGLTRDFLGLTAFPNSRDQCLFLPDLQHMGSSYEHQNHQN